MLGKCYKIVVAYEGTNYCGWQIQKNCNTVVQALQNTFLKVFNSKIKLLGASRTDAGVHARGQVARFETSVVVTPAKMLYGWNNQLPNDIVIKDIQLISKEFHPFRHVKQKTYFYHIFLKRPTPFCQRYGWYVPFSIDLEKLKAALQMFVGTHDFRSFCTGAVKNDNTVRTIDKITTEFVQELNAWRIVVKGRGFLYHMVRRMIGAAVDVAFKDTLSVESIKSALQEKNPKQLFQTAPAKGLMLYNVLYEKEKDE